MLGRLRLVEIMLRQVYVEAFKKSDYSKAINIDAYHKHQALQVSFAGLSPHLNLLKGGLDRL
jgi:hypothetical protein